jgi:hypothetical protein
MMKEMKKMMMILVCIVAVGSLAGCASTNLTAPCKGYGQSCFKTPINSWNYKN